MIRDLEPLVVKIGGRALEDPGAPEELAAEVTALRGATLLVHGGGGEVSAWCQVHGIPPRFLDGLRVTDAATLEIAVAVLAGLANKRLVATLRAAGCDAVGLAALDGGIVEAAPHPDAARLGAVGAIGAVQPDLLATLLAQGRVPVLASIAAARGRLLNVNADDLAAAVAAALGARALVLGGAPVARLSAEALDEALGHPDVQGGMKPKLRAAQTALQAGVPRVHLGAWRGHGTLAALLQGEGAGTRIDAGAAVPGAAPAHAEATHG